MPHIAYVKHLYPEDFFMFAYRMSQYLLHKILSIWSNVRYSGNDFLNVVFCKIRRNITLTSYNWCSSPLWFIRRLHDSTLKSRNEQPGTRGKRKHFKRCHLPHNKYLVFIKMTLSQITLPITYQNNYSRFGICVHINYA